MKKTDNQLMEQLIVHENMRAFEELVIRYRRSAVQFAFRYCRDHYLAEDLAQEAFARIFLQRKKFLLSGNFRAYFFQILRNICIDYYRGHSKIKEEQLVEEIVSGEITGNQNNEHLTLLKSLFRSLNEKYKTVLYLYEFERLTYHQIAKVMKIGQGQVRMLLYRARKKLKKIAKEELKVHEKELDRIYELE